MTSGSINNWHRVWSKRSLPSVGSIVERLIAIDGFDSPLGYMTEADWRKYLALFTQRAGIMEGDSIFEIGCGGGALLYPFFETGYTVSGIDYSRELVEIARSMMPDRAAFLNSMEASACPTEPRTEVVVANHVIHYFPSLSYASDVVDAMLRKASRVVAVSGVPIVDLRDESELERRGLLTREEYEAKYVGLEILYYDRNWFTSLAKRHGFVAQFFDHEMPGFAQNRFRFDCVMTQTRS